MFEKECCAPPNMSSSDEEEAEFDDGENADASPSDHKKTQGKKTRIQVSVEIDADGDTAGSGRKRRSSRGVVVSYKEDDDVGDEEAEEEANEDDDEEANEEDDDDDDDESADDEDDDMPLMSLKSPEKKTPTKKNGTKPKSPAKKKTKTAKKKAVKKEVSVSASKTSTGSSSSSTDYKSASFALYGTESSKGLLIQRLLCRWWYAITWPNPADIPDKPPPNYDAMDGFPGVYVCTKGEEVGTIKDFRDKAKAPNFNNFAKMTSVELRDLLIKAIKEQRRQLVQAEGQGTSTEKDLNAMLHWAEKLNTSKADKEAATILKANKLKLPE